MRRNMMLGALALALVATPFAARADDADVATQIVDTMNKLFGRHPGVRANHAEGIVALGQFTPAPAAEALSKAAIFQGGPYPVTVRFSNATGIPAIDDGAPNANPHGMAVRIELPDGSPVDIVANSLPQFPVATGEEFRDLLMAAAASGPGAPEPTPLQAFVKAHPTVPAATGGLKTPTSFARETYNGVNTFFLVDEAGTRQPFRWKIVPAARDQDLTPDEAKAQAPDFLSEELRTRLAQGPAGFGLLAQLAEPGDPLEDATKAWPAERRLVELGTITLDGLAPDNDAAAAELLYLPTNLVDGIEPSNDPLIEARVAAYAVSFQRRSE